MLHRILSTLSAPPEDSFFENGFNLKRTIKWFLENNQMIHLKRINFITKRYSQKFLTKKWVHFEVFVTKLRC